MVKRVENAPGPAASTRADTLRCSLENDIISGKLVPGQRLDELRLATQYNVSRTPVREALRYLAASGLVEMRMRQGAVVVKLTVTEVIDAFQVMAELEGLCARLAARRISPEQSEALNKAHLSCVAMVEQNDHEGFYQANQTFHEIIYAASHNKVLKEHTYSLRMRVGPYRHYVTYQPGRMAASIEEHVAVMEAVLAGEVEKADTLMCAHVALLGEELTDFISFMRANDEDLRAKS
jgi:DNA-binding GntR family transcriptional regulator